jgi:hypothetical protein
MTEPGRDDALRTEQLMSKVTPELSARVNGFARANRWTRSTAAAVLLQRALDAEDREHAGTAAG